MGGGAAARPRLHPGDDARPRAAGGGGDKQAAEYFFGWLELHPEMRSEVRQLDDLATKTERLWVQRLCGDDALSRRALEDELTAMRAGLLGPDPSVADRVLAGTVVVAHLAFQRAATHAVLPADKPEVRAARDKLLSLAQRRLQDAVRGWGLYARTKARGLRPKGNLKLFEPGGAA